ncbi:MAG: regulator of protease activity HflC (stomatin/prohibitin superfamily) [Cellvibrionaceae bacterium]|jgi:regulator of protease activity HflC (stomatin/prohibitin superfamily)
MGEFLGVIGILIFFAVIIGTATVRVVQEYERGVIFRLGRVIGAKGPGLFFVIPVIDKMIKVDLRTITLDVPTQEAITSDNVTVRVNAVLYFQVVDPVAAVINIENYRRGTSQISQTSLRNVIGQSTLDELLSAREYINRELQKIIDEATEPWGIKVSIVEVKDVELNSQMIRAMARQAEAERERRAKVIHAEGELQASEKLSLAAQALAKEPGAMTLRYLQTLVEIGVEQNTTTIFPIPIDLIQAVLPSLQSNRVSNPEVKDQD